MPLTLPSSPVGSPGAALAGAGRLTEAGSVGAAARRWPRAPTAAAPTVAPAAPTRNVRRPVVEGTPSAWAEWSRGDSWSCVDVAAGGWPGSRRSRPLSTPMPTTAAAKAGMTSAGEAVGRRTAASPARAARTTTSTPARPCRRRATRPMAMAARAVTTATLLSRTALSAVPKLRTAHSFTGVGVASMTVDPTARTGEDAGSTKAATRWPTAIPVRAAMRPHTAYPRRWVFVVGCMDVIRTRPRCGWVRVGRPSGGRVAWWRASHPSPAQLRRVHRHRGDPRFRARIRRRAVRGRPGHDRVRAQLQRLLGGALPRDPGRLRPRAGRRGRRRPAGTPRLTPSALWETEPRGTRRRTADARP